MDLHNHSPLLHGVVKYKDNFTSFYSRTMFCICIHMNFLALSHTTRTIIEYGGLALLRETYVRTYRVQRSTEALLS